MAGRIFPALALLIVGVTFISVSCVGKKQVPLSELKEYPLNPDHGLIKTGESGDFSFELIYRPKDLVIKQHVEDDLTLWDSIAAQLQIFDYFILSISKNDRAVEAHYASSPGLYTSILDYFNTGISNDITMFVGNEEVRVTSTLFSPVYGMANASSVLLVFESDLSNRRENFKIVFEDTHLGSGHHEFDFEFSSIEKIPELKVSQ